MKETKSFEKKFNNKQELQAYLIDVKKKSGTNMSIGYRSILKLT